jgi:hypothetical protein
LVGWAAQLLVAVGEVRSECSDRLVEAVEVANRSWLMVVEGLVSIGDRLVARGGRSVVEARRIGRGAADLEMSGERHDRVALVLNSGGEIASHAWVKRVLAGEVADQVACVFDGLGV